MARGSVAKEKVTEKIKAAFGADYVGEVDKKIYVWADDGGERVQIALAMTCPKTFVNTVNTASLNYNNGIDFSGEDTVVVAPEKVEISDEEKENVRNLMQRLGL